MGNGLFLSIRVLHVLLAALWLGSAAFISYILMPAVEASGPAGGQVMITLNRKGLVPYMASIAGTTVLTGIYLYWRFTGGFDPTVSRTNAGMAFGVGGVCGLIAAIIGGSVIGRSSKKVVEVLQKAATMPDNAERRALMQEADVLRQRLSTFGNVVVILQVIALALMAVAHYI